MTISESKKNIQNALKDIQQWQKYSNKINRVGIFTTTWYPEVISGLNSSCSELLEALHIEENKIDRVKVSGSWELPLAVSAYMKKSKPSFVIVLGCVVKGETPHFDILCNTVANNLMSIQLEEGIPLGFGILTVNNETQALQRMGKGAEATEAAFRSWLALEKTSVKVNAGV
jgi:6,7-dimethyl-8-ribityllumazine synthase